MLVVCSEFTRRGWKWSLGVLFISLYVLTTWITVFEKLIVTPSEEIPYLLWNLKLYCSIHKSLPLDPILSPLSPTYNLSPCFVKINFIIIFPSPYRSPKWSLVVFQSKIMYAFLITSTGSGVNTSSYPLSSGGSYPGGKVVGTWSWPLTSI
jgi:hypothetical protein